MKSIRRCTFETNSSSTHSMSFVGGDYCYYLENEDSYDDYTLHVRLGEFGWEWRDYTTPTEKLQYLITMRCEQLGCTESIWDTKNTEEFKEIIYNDSVFQDIVSAVVSNTQYSEIAIDSFCGYVDNQSVQDVEDVVYEAGASSIESFIFGPYKVRPGNDNSSDPEKPECWWSNSQE